MRAVRGALRRLRGDWEAGLGRLPFFTQRTAVLLFGVLVATLVMLGGVVALVGWPGAGGPTHLVPGERAGRAPASRPAPGDGPAPGVAGAGDRSGAGVGGAAAASPSPAPGAGSAASPSPEAAARSARPERGGAGRVAGGAAPGGTATGAQGSGGAAGAGAGGPPAAPPTTSPPATTPGPLDPVEELLGPAVSTLLP